MPHAELMTLEWGGAGKAEGSGVGGGPGPCGPGVAPVATTVNKRKNTTPLKAYAINNNQLDWVDTYKYLSVIIHKKLSWSNRIVEASSKTMKVLNLLRRTMHGTSNASKQLAYIALVLPHLEYCLPIWNPHQKKSSKN